MWKRSKFLSSDFFVATYGNTDLRNCSHISKHCTKPASEDEMCPRSASFSTFKLGSYRLRASIRRTSVSFLYFFFRSLAQPAAGHTKTKILK